MVLSMILDEYLGLSKTFAMILAGIFLVLLGGAHVLAPAESTVGLILGASNDLTSITGIATRVVGLFVLGTGLDVLDEAY